MPDKKLAPKLKAKLRICMSCEWVYRGDPSQCPLCGWPSYGARWVYGNKAYDYEMSQKPWKEKKLFKYEEELNRIIREKARPRHKKIVFKWTYEEE